MASLIVQSYTISNSFFRKLHGDGILDEHLKLRKNSTLLEELLDNKEKDPRKPKSGTRQSRAYYPVELPEEFTSVKINKKTCLVYR
jgi:hypothetical protein